MKAKFQPPTITLKNYEGGEISLIGKVNACVTRGKYSVNTTLQVQSKALLVGLAVCNDRIRRILWHDHSTVAGAGYLLMTIHTKIRILPYMQNMKGTLVESVLKLYTNTGRKYTQTVQQEPEL